MGGWGFQICGVDIGLVFDTHTENKYVSRGWRNGWERCAYEVVYFLAFACEVVKTINILCNS